jgi:hypothetical protein
MKGYLLLLIMALFITQHACTSSTEPETDSNNNLALSARIESNRHIVVVDCNDPKNYQIISGSEHAAWNPIYSPDKRYILYGDARLSVDAGYHLILYDTHTGELKDWPHPFFPDPNRLHGEDVVWDLQSDGFYFSEVQMGVPQNILYMDINTNTLTTICEEYLSSPVGIKDAETLIVLSANESAGGPPGYYYMNMNGGFLGPVENQYLRLEYDQNWVSTRLAMGLEYHPNHELFVFELVDTLKEGKRICITNLDGSYFEELTSNYKDSNPTYVSSDNIVYFDRMELTESGFRHFPIMKVNVHTKKVTEFFSVDVIPGGVEVKEPNF